MINESNQETKFVKSGDERLLLEVRGDSEFLQDKYLDNIIDKYGDTLTKNMKDWDVDEVTGRKDYVFPLSQELIDKFEDEFSEAAGLRLSKILLTRILGGGYSWQPSSDEFLLDTLEHAHVNIESVLNKDGIDENLLNLSEEEAPIKLKEVLEESLEIDDEIVNKFVNHDDDKNKVEEVLKNVFPKPHDVKLSLRDHKLEIPEEVHSDLQLYTFAKGLENDLTNEYERNELDFIKFDENVLQRELDEHLKSLINDFNNAKNLQNQDGLNVKIKKMIEYNDSLEKQNEMYDNVEKAVKSISSVYKKDKNIYLIDAIKKASKSFDEENLEVYKTRAKEALINHGEGISKIDSEVAKLKAVLINQIEDDLLKVDNPNNNFANLPTLIKATRFINKKEEYNHQISEAIQVVSEINKKITSNNVEELENVYHTDDTDDDVLENPSDFILPENMGATDILDADEDFGEEEFNHVEESGEFESMVTDTEEDEQEEGEFFEEEGNDEGNDEGNVGSDEYYNVVEHEEKVLEPLEPLEPLTQMVSDEDMQQSDFSKQEEPLMDENSTNNDDFGLLENDSNTTNMSNFNNELEESNYNKTIDDREIDNDFEETPKEVPTLQHTESFEPSTENIEGHQEKDIVTVDDMDVEPETPKTSLGKKILLFGGGLGLATVLGVGGYYVYDTLTEDTTPAKTEQASNPQKTLDYSLFKVGDTFKAHSKGQAVKVEITKLDEKAKKIYIKTDSGREKVLTESQFVSLAKDLINQKETLRDSELPQSDEDEAKDTPDAETKKEDVEVKKDVEKEASKTDSKK